MDLLQQWGLATKLVGNKGHYGIFLRERKGTNYEKHFPYIGILTETEILVAHSAILRVDFRERYDYFVGTGVLGAAGREHELGTAPTRTRGR